MNRLLLKLAMTATVGSLLFSSPTVAQVLPPADKAATRPDHSRTRDRIG